MIDPIRSELFDILRELSEVAPDVRLGQLILNLSYMARGLEDSSAWEIEDTELLTIAKHHLETWRARHTVSAA